MYVQIFSAVILNDDVILQSYRASLASLVAQLVKNSPAMWETGVRPAGWEDPLEEGMTAYSSIPAWRIPMTEEPGRLQSMVSQSDMTERLSTSQHIVLQMFTLCTYINIYKFAALQILSLIVI